jgi:hypothetical protein
MRTALVAGAAVLTLVMGGGAHASDPPTRSSLLAFVESVALAIEQRARDEGVAGNVRMEVTGARGVDPRKAEREFGARLFSRLRDGGVVLPVSSAPLRATLVLSQEHARVWAICVFEGGKLPGTSTVAVSAPVDRELEVALGAGSRRPGQRRWAKERLGTVPGGVLDAVLLDVDGDLADDIVLLSVDGLRAYRYAPGDARPELIGGPWRLPDKRTWPRVRTGWMAATKDGKLWVATSAGHAKLFDPRERRWAPPPQRGVPVRQPLTRRGTGERMIVLGGRFGSPDLVPPAASSQGRVLAGPNLPALVRDVARYPGRENTWVWIDADGRLGGHVRAERPVLLPTPERAGDRLLLVDLDNDGPSELVTSAATPPGEPDEITIWQLDPGLSSITVLLRTALSGGAVVAMADGELDFDGNADVLVVEEGAGEEAVLWRLERAP